MNKKAEQLFSDLNDGKDFLVKDPELREIMINYLYGDVYHHGNLDFKLRELILIVVNTTNHTLKALKEHVTSGLSVGVTPVEIKEAVYQCTPYIGLGKVEEALEIVNLVFEEKNISLPLLPQATVQGDNRFEKGFAVQSAAFGQEHIQAGHDHAPKELKHIQNYLSGILFWRFLYKKWFGFTNKKLITMVMCSYFRRFENQCELMLGQI